ncbi:excisionase family DNA-binding protein [Nakamurella sp.]|uniref:excisionase family DNA-binding protein n=1 Tax=Nakamurella sp. TaxID=1869182 RepID=UPI003B3A0AE2
MEAIEAPATTITAKEDMSPKLLLRIEEAAKQLGIGRSLMYRLVMSGAIESVRLGRLRRIPAECLGEHVRRLRDEARSSQVT